MNFLFFCPVLPCPPQFTCHSAAAILKAPAHHATTDRGLIVGPLKRGGSGGGGGVGCGSTQCPWLIANDAGQSFLFSVYRFAANATPSSRHFHDKAHHERLSISDNCQRVALIRAHKPPPARRRDDDVTAPAAAQGKRPQVVREVRMCDSDARIKTFTVSEWHSLQIELLPPAALSMTPAVAASSGSRQQPPRFLLSYRGKTSFHVDPRGGALLPE